MIQQTWFIFDSTPQTFGPITDCRAAFDLRCGTMTARQRLTRAVGQAPAGAIVQSHLRALVNEHLHTVTSPDELVVHDDVLLVNGCWLTDTLPKININEALVTQDGAVLIARLVGSVAATWLRAGTLTGDTLPDTVAIAKVQPDAQTPLISRPWHLIEHLETVLRRDLSRTDVPRATSLPEAVTVMGDKGVHVAGSAKLHAMVVLNCESGPIVIDEGATVQSFSVLGGPCYVGRHTIITPHSHIRAKTSIGDHCVVGGEISASVIHDCSNKCHSGYLGNSVVGSWVNLGADTTVSNLKNTWGNVRMQLDERDAISTGQLKLGPLICDFVRTAIGSRLLTGSCIGTGSMIAVDGFAPKYVPAMRFITSESDERYDVERFLDTARIAMSRRGVDLTPAMENRFRAIAAATKFH
jgi:UDP-N-acetylglucosamine diphosphorylase/glucosamine-1-phosphate N-acetyltransferase